MCWRKGIGLHADARYAACRPRLTAAQGPRIEQRAILARTFQKSQSKAGAARWALPSRFNFLRPGFGSVSVSSAPLDGNTSVTEPTAINAIRSVLLGGFAPATAANPRPYSMPPFAQQLSEEDVAAVVSYVRQSWSNKASAATPVQVSRYRHTPVD